MNPKMMKAKVILMPLLAWLLGGCIQDSNQLNATAGETMALGETIHARAAELHYTSHPAAAPSRSEIVPLVVADGFSIDQRAKILRAVNEWNVALNGFLRFEIVSDVRDVPTAAAASWTIVAQHGGRSSGSSTMLATTYPIAGIGGVMVIYVDHIGRRDLGGVAMHELGHVLGLDHDPRGHLMAARYHPTSQQCVDRSAAEAIAAKRRLPLAQLNWCEPAGT